MTDSITTKASPASGAEAEAAKPQTEAGAEESRPVASGVSSKFDSFGAAMRMAAMTAPEDAENMGKHLNAVKQAAPPASVKHTSAVKSSSSKSATQNSNLLLIIIVLLILLGLVLIL